MGATQEIKVPKQMEPVYAAITAITDAFCREHLNQEYLELCRKLTATLCRKRPSPIAPGKENLWACGIVYALGKVNFLGDKSFTPYLPMKQVPQLLGVSSSTAAGYARRIENLLRMGPLDPRWCLPSLLDQNPQAWLIMVNGFIVDARQMPREVQEEAFRKGLIPYLPAAGAMDSR